MGINEKAWDIGFKRLIGDESLGAVWGIAVENTNKQLHILDIADADTDWGLSADSYPSVYLHGSASASEYAKLYVDSTDFHLQTVGNNIVLDAPTSGDITLQVNSTDEYVFNATTLNMGSNTFTNAGNLVFVTGRSIVGTALTFDPGGTAMRFAAANFSATGSGTVTLSVQGPAAVGSVICTTWLKIEDSVGTTAYYLPGFTA